MKKEEEELVKEKTEILSDKDVEDSVQNKVEIVNNKNKDDKWYTKFKAIFYCLSACAIMSISSILIKKCKLFSGFEQAAVINQTLF